MKRALDFDDVMIIPQYSNVKSRKDVNLNRKFQFNNGTSWEGIPIIAANMQNIGTVKVANILTQYNMLTALVKGTENAEQYVNTFETFGLNDPVDNENFISLDVANGHMKSFINYVANIRYWHPKALIMAGNVATMAGARQLANAGADIIKVGLGSGAACLTREKTGVGVPQLQAVMDCQNVDALICSDGGCRTPGDVAKAFAAGADFVMLGEMFSGTDVTGYELRGNSLVGTSYSYKTEEGKIMHCPYKGKLTEVVDDLLGGLRSACSYVGAHDLEEFQIKAKFIVVR